MFIKTAQAVSDSPGGRQFLSWYFELQASYVAGAELILEHTGPRFGRLWYRRYLLIQMERVIVCVHHRTSSNQ